jgi:hypothetical protein
MELGNGEREHGVTPHQLGYWIPKLSASGEDPLIIFSDRLATGGGAPKGRRSDRIWEKLKRLHPGTVRLRGKRAATVHGSKFIQATSLRRCRWFARRMFHLRIHQKFFFGLLRVFSEYTAARHSTSA